MVKNTSEKHIKFIKKPIKVQQSLVKAAHGTGCYITRKERQTHLSFLPVELDLTLVTLVTLEGVPVYLE